MFFFTAPLLFDSSKDRKVNSTYGMSEVLAIEYSTVIVFWR
jgi:hypothetical protein